MKESFGSNSENKEVNLANSEAVADLENNEIRSIITESGLVKEGDVVSPEDYEAVRSRAKVLLESSTEPISEEASILAAFVDRMQLKQNIGEEVLKSLPNETLKAVLYAENQTLFTDEELDLFKSSELPLGEWAAERVSVRETLQ